MTDELSLMAFCCELRLYAFTRVFEIFSEILKGIFKLPHNHHRCAQNLTVDYLYKQTFEHFYFETNFFNTFHFIDPSTCLEIAKNCHNDFKTYLLFAYKQKK